MHSGLDLDAWLARVGLDAPPAPTAEGLAELHLAHATHIPFENIDVLLGRPIRLDVASLQAKLVGARRGGYCFEHNLLFAAVLDKLGFRVTGLGARVRYRTTRTLARTHMLLLVETEGEPMLADVGFGGSGLLLPLRLEAGRVERQFDRDYRLLKDGATWTLQGAEGGEGSAFEDYYAFTLDPQEPADYEMANHYVSTHPDSPFVQRLTVQRCAPDVRHILRGSELTVERGGTSATRTIAERELRDLLRTTFGLALPDDVHIPQRRSFA